ncbi:MAG TPA: TauD/TfdA family dioxygenase [Burkholderiaceae bacterium]|nr:TauD/TfdA family dioxygenase [Burkholderiaceae bacterium]
MSTLIADPPAAGLRRRSPFDLGDDAAYRAWRARKLADRARTAAELMVDVADPRALRDAEREALLQRCARWNMAIYRTVPGGDQDKDVLRALAAQLGLLRLDANWLADEDGISSIAVRGGAPAPGQDRGAFIPYTDHALKWHTDGYYHPGERRIRAMLLHCVRPAARGGENLLLDHELAYIAVRDASPRWMRALMAADAMTIPAREGASGEARAAQSGPVFSVDPHDGALHMRYTARTRSIVWKQDKDTLAAVAFLEQWLAGGPDGALRVRLGAGMGLVSHNVLHDRSAFVDDPARPRLVYRARYLDRLERPETPWPNG